jgi:type IV pilus assembly protein PilC
MATYTYKARDTMGKSVKGTMDAVSREELVEKLQKMGYMTTKVSESLPDIKLDVPFAKFMRRVSGEDMIKFSIQLANMINAGISILSSLEALSKQTENKLLKDTLGDVKRNIEAGESLSHALSMHPRIFSPLMLHMVRAGETSGKLSTVLTRFAEFSEYQMDLQQKVKGALFYPTILFFAGVAVTLFIVTFIIPQFVEIFTRVGIKLPFVTLMLYKIGMGIRQLWYLGVLGLGLIWLLVTKVYVKTERGRLNLDRLKLKLFIIGILYRKTIISRFSRTLGTLLASGVPILQSLDIVKGVVGNEVLARVIGSARNAVEKGEKISESLKVSEEFPPDMIEMITAGEESGSLTGMLDKVASFYDRSLGYTIKKLTTVLEPLFLAVMGAMVGFIMASMLLPMFDMMKILRH